VTSFQGLLKLYEKRNDELYALVLPFNNFKIGIPEALSKGMYNFNLLSRITARKACKGL
jgi:hypothetical protein